MSARKITPIHYQKLIRIFELDGFEIKRQKVDHILMTKPGVSRPLVIKSSPKKASQGQTFPGRFPGSDRKRRLKPVKDRE